MHCRPLSNAALVPFLVLVNAFHVMVRGVRGPSAVQGPTSRVLQAIRRAPSQMQQQRLPHSACSASMLPPLPPGCAPHPTLPLPLLPPISPG